MAVEPAQKSLDLFDRLPREAKDFLAKRSTEKTLKRGDRLYLAGDEPRGLYFLKEGLVGLVFISEAGSEHLLRLFRSGQVLGHRSLFANELHHATAVSLQHSTVSFLPKLDVEELLQNFPEVQRMIIEILAKELKVAEVRRVRISEEDVVGRTAKALIVLKDLHPKHTWTRQEIASFCASTAPSVVRALARLEEMGLIQQTGRDIEIVDRDGLLNLEQ